MFKILFVIGITVFISTAYGLFVRESFQLHKDKYSAPLGFAALLLSLQFLYYPAQLFNWPSIYIHIVSSIIYLIIFIYGLTKLKQIFFEYWNLKTLWVIAYTSAFIFVFYFMSIAIARADGQMYLNYIAQNVDIEHLNMFNLWTGKTGAEFVSVYFFQGYYHFASFWVKFVNVFAALGIGSYIDSILISVWGLGILLALISSLMIVNFVSYFKYKSVWIERILLFIALFYTNFYYWKVAFAFYGNSWRSIFMAMLAYYLYRLVKEGNKNDRYSAAIVFGASIAASSSSLFIGFSMLYGLAYYWFRNKHQHTLEDLSIIAFPMVVYVLGLQFKDHFSMFLILLPITLIYYVGRFSKPGKKLLLTINNFFSNYHLWIFIIIIPILAIIYSFYSLYVDIYYPWNLTHYFNNHADYDMVKDYLFLYSNPIEKVLNLFRWGSITLLFFKFRKIKENNYQLSHFLMLALLFLNPLTTSFVSKAFASNVYYRLYESLFNAFTEILLFGVLLNYFWEKKIYRYLIVSGFVFAGFNMHYSSFILKENSSDYGFYIKQGEEVLPLYKIKGTEYDVIKALQNELKNVNLNGSHQITVVSHADTLRTYIPQVYVLFTPREYYTPGDRVDENFYQIARLWYNWEEKPSLDYSNTCTYIKEFDVDYVISERYVNYEFDGALNDCTNVIYENEEFNVRKVIK